MAKEFNFRLNWYNNVTKERGYTYSVGCTRYKIGSVFDRYTLVGIMPITASEAERMEYGV